ncbi:MAG TPA: amino acid ABC transporter substrate-binding protein [Acidimicrobiales bacterium]|nr:amino acid ABC transporter substrate-binding protein [Acidimicrobiales bacterium]
MTTLSRRFRWGAAAVALSLVFAACSGDDDDDGATPTTTDTEITLVQNGNLLATIQERGTVRCGTRDALPGFAVLTPDGDHVGFDADFCRVIAAAILGDADAVDFIDLATEARFTALQSGEIDVLVRNTTWTAGRDGNEGATFLQPNFYDGQGMMVAADSPYQTVADMDGATICVASGTTTEGNVSSEFSRLGITPAEVLSFPEVDLIQEAFLAGRCDGWSSDRSQLTGLRSEYPEGEDALRILEDVFSKEPLAPAVRDGEVELAQAVQWAIFATIQAEEFGITSSNIGDFEGSDNPGIRTFLGETEEGGTFDPGLGLPADFAVQVISQVGNYGEIFDAHLAPLGLERGVNSLWTEGGLLYAPPYR